MEIPANAERFTPMQLHLLQLFAKNPPEEELNDIRRLIARYYADKLGREMDEHIQRQGKTVDEWVAEIMNTDLRAELKKSRSDQNSA